MDVSVDELGGGEEVFELARGKSGCGNDEHDEERRSTADHAVVIAQS